MQVFFKFIKYNYVERGQKQGQNRANLSSFNAVTYTLRDTATPPVHFLWKNRLPCNDEPSNC